MGFVFTTPVNYTPTHIPSLITTSELRFKNFSIEPTTESGNGFLCFSL